jgi:NAD(P)-dependent dehydrogenase (short-subunit alcohol dehydrogenase family)
MPVGETKSGRDTTTVDAASKPAASNLHVARSGKRIHTSHAQAKGRTMATDTTNRSLLWATGGLAALWAARALWRRATAYSFRDKVVLITGGARGFGLVLARRFAAEGAKVAFCARDQAELERAEAEFRQKGIEVLAIPCDITQQDEVKRMVDDVLGFRGRIDVLVNNAGVIQTGPVEEMTQTDFREAMNIHFWGSFSATQAVLPAMRAQGGGRIVNITSIGGKLSVPHLLPYCASKFAQVGFSEGLRAELAKDGIVVTTVCPGLMRTGSPRNAKFKGQHRAEYAWFSIGDSLPILSISAESAARKVLNACRHGDAVLIYTLPARFGAKFHGVFPGLTADLLGLVSRLLPGPGGIGSRAAKGKESTSHWSPSLLTALSERAAARNNEL